MINAIPTHSEMIPGGRAGGNGRGGFSTGWGRHAASVPVWAKSAVLGWARLVVTGWILAMNKDITYNTATCALVR